MIARFDQTPTNRRWVAGKGRGAKANPGQVELPATTHLLELKSDRAFRVHASDREML